MKHSHHIWTFQWNDGMSEVKWHKRRHAKVSNENERHFDIDETH